MKIVICWSDVSGYWGACWRELAGRTGIELFVLAFMPVDEAGFDVRLMVGLNHRLLSPEECKDAGLVQSIVEGQKPDAIISVGWFVTAYRALASAPTLRHVKKFMVVDTPWRNELQYLTRLRYWRYFGALDGVGVAGERSWQYVRRLGFKARSVQRGMHGVDSVALGRVFDRRDASGWQRNFLFVGRYTPVKAVDVLVDAYRLYRRRVDSPWALTCCGSGELKPLLQGAEGIQDLGFVQPDAMSEVWLSGGMFILPSRFDPWPLALVEAATTGLPIIATDVCGSGVEVLRHLYNGYIVPPENPRALADAMIDSHRQPLARWGRRSRDLAGGFGAAEWADRWIELIESASEGIGNAAR